MVSWLNAGWMLKVQYRRAAEFESAKINIPIKQQTNSTLSSNYLVENEIWKCRWCDPDHEPCACHACPFELNTHVCAWPCVWESGHMFQSASTRGQALCLSAPGLINVLVPVASHRRLLGLLWTCRMMCAFMSIPGLWWLHVKLAHVSCYGGRVWGP